MPDAVFAIPGDIDLPTGGYAYDRRVMALLGRFGVAVRHLALPGSFPHPTPGDLAETERALRGVDPRAVLMVDGLAYGALPTPLIDALRNPILALVHHPLGLEAGLDAARKEALLASERAALVRARRVVVTSRTTAAALVADFAVPPDSITVAVPGTDPALRAPGTGSPLQLLSIGAVIPRKAHDILVRALAPLRHHDWRLTIVGPMDRDAGALTALQAAVRETGLGERVALAGPAGTDQLARHYAAADLFVMASLYEGYGMALAEALARGLPMVCTTGGAAAETVPDGAAIKVPPNDEQALTQALARVMADAGLRRALGEAAWAAGRRLPTWADTACIVAGAVNDIAPGDAAS